MANDNMETATLAAGCFWCVEAVFDDLKGVEDVVSGYSGGHKDNPHTRKYVPRRPATPRSHRSHSTRTSFHMLIFFAFFLACTIRRSSTVRATISAPHTAQRSFITRRSRSKSPKR